MQGEKEQPETVLPTASLLPFPTGIVGSIGVMLENPVYHGGQLRGQFRVAERWIGQNGVFQRPYAAIFAKRSMTSKYSRQPIYQHSGISTTFIAFFPGSIGWKPR